MRTKAGARAKPQPRSNPNPVQSIPDPIRDPIHSKPDPIQTQSITDPIRPRSNPNPIRTPGGRRSIMPDSIPWRERIKIHSNPNPSPGTWQDPTRLLNQPNTNPNRLLIQPLILGSGILSSSSYMETDPAGLKHESPEAHRMGMWKGRPRTQSLTRTNPLVGKDQRHTSRTETETCGVDRKPLSGGSKESGWRNKWRNSPDEW